MHNDHIIDTVLTAGPEHTAKVAVYWIIIINIIDELDIFHTCSEVVRKCRSWSCWTQSIKSSSMLTLFPWQEER